MSSHSHRSWQLPFGSQPALELRADATSVAIVPVSGDEAPHLEAIGRGADRLDLRIDRVGDRVNVAIEPFRQFTWWGGWDTRLVVHVPPAVSARVETSAGSIDVRHLDGCDLDLKASAGRIDLDSVRGRLKLAADAGSIRGHDLAGRIWAETQAGSIRLEITGLEPGEHRVRASMGQVRVDLAQGLEVKVESRASMGSSRVSYPSYPNASAVLQLSTEMGAIRVGEGSSAVARSARHDAGHANGRHAPGGVPPVPPRPGGWPWAPPPGSPPSSPPAGWQPPTPPAPAASPGPGDTPTAAGAPGAPAPAEPTPLHDPSWPFSGEPPFAQSSAGAPPTGPVAPTAPEPTPAAEAGPSVTPSESAPAAQPTASAPSTESSSSPATSEHPPTPLHAPGVGESRPWPPAPDPQQGQTEAGAGLAGSWPTSPSPEAAATQTAGGAAAGQDAAAPAGASSAAASQQAAGQTPQPATASSEPAAVEAGSSSDASAKAGAASGDGELEHILEMVAVGDLSARDAEELLRAMGRV
jgi:hypothetical protein